MAKETLDIEREGEEVVVYYNSCRVGSAPLCSDGDRKKGLRRIRIEIE